MKFAVESWDPGYGISTDENGLTEARQPVDLDVEVPGGEWQPIAPDGSNPPAAVMFVDGVRRIDARVWVQPGADSPDFESGLAKAGVCATVAAGVVRSDADGARLVDAVVERALYTAAADAGPIVTKHGTYELRPVAGDGDDPLHSAIQHHMLSTEAGLEVEAVGNDVVVFDGPLWGRDAVAGVGYVKTQQVQYLPTEQHAVVGSLGPGQRTPLFLIGGPFTRWSWYLRLPGPIAHPLSGVVRLELPGRGEAHDAAARADTVSAVLPRYASVPHKDSRAPQNLHPIAGLERELRRRLGDPQLLERALRQHAAAASRAGTAAGSAPESSVFGH